jgi:hypothetical protein
MCILEQIKPQIGFAKVEISYIFAPLNRPGGGIGRHARLRALWPL